MKIELTLNVIDVLRLAQAEMQRRVGECELVGLTVMSWNRVLLRVEGQTLVQPVRHHLNYDHAELKPPPLQKEGPAEASPKGFQHPEEKTTTREHGNSV